jgi:ribosome-binding factor A
MTQRGDQVESVLHRAVQQVLSKGLNDPRVRGLLSVTDVVVSDDLRQATVSVSILPAEHVELSMHGLKHAARHIRVQVGELVRMRRVPELHFRLDASLKQQAEVELAIRDAMEDDET